MKIDELDGMQTDSILVEELVPESTLSQLNEAHDGEWFSLDLDAHFAMLDKLAQNFSV